MIKRKKISSSYFTYDNNGEYIVIKNIDCKYEQKQIVIPDFIDDLPVKIVDSHCLNGFHRTINELLISKNIEAIKDFAFSDTFIQKLIIESKKITLHEKSFFNCSKLSTIICLQEDAIVNCEKKCFEGANSLRLIKFDNYYNLTINNHENTSLSKETFGGLDENEIIYNNIVYRINGKEAEAVYAKKEMKSLIFENDVCFQNKLYPVAKILNGFSIKLKYKTIEKLHLPNKLKIIQDKAFDFVSFYCPIILPTSIQSVGCLQNLAHLNIIFLPKVVFNKFILEQNASLLNFEVILTDAHEFPKCSNFIIDFKKIYFDIKHDDIKINNCNYYILKDDGAYLLLNCDLNTSSSEVKLTKSIWVDNKEYSLKGILNNSTNCHGKKIIIPNTVMFIDNESIKDCREVVFEENSNCVFIGECAIQSCYENKTIQLPNKVKFLGGFNNVHFTLPNNSSIEFLDASSLYIKNDDHIIIPKATKTLILLNIKKKGICINFEEIENLEFLFISGCPYLETFDKGPFRYLSNESKTPFVLLDVISYWLPYLKIDNECKFITNDAFRLCSNLMRVDFSDSLITSSALYSTFEVETNKENLSLINYESCKKRYYDYRLKIMMELKLYEGF